MTEHFQTARVFLPNNVTTQLAAATTGCTQIRLTAYPSVNGAQVYISNSDATAPDPNQSYPIVPGIEYQMPGVEQAVYGWCTGGAIVYVTIYWTA